MDNSSLFRCIKLRGRDADQDQWRLRSGLRQAAARCRFKKGQSGNPGGCQPGSKTLLNDALNEQETITENGRRRKITKREAVIKQLVNKSASADPRSLKILLDLMVNLEARVRSSGDPAPAVGPGRRLVLT